MAHKSNHVAASDMPAMATNRVGFYSAIFTVLITAVTFSFAIVAIPVSGANCIEGCIEYPYLETLAQFPKDY